MREYMQIHWWTPFLMLMSFVSGILFALGHHFFYRSLDGRPTLTSNERGAQHFGQQVNIAIGTAFAFLVKAALVLSVTTTYYQLFWRSTIRESKSGKSPTLGWLDAAFSGTSSVSSLLCFPMWLRYPLLFSIAMSAWLLPIASIITPATLSVVLQENIANVTSQFVPQIDFNNLNFVAGMPSMIGVNRISLNYIYNGPSQIAQQIALAVAARNSILPIVAPYPNSTWALDFHGPALKCKSLQPDQGLDFQQNIARHLLRDENCAMPPTYLAWFPRVVNAENDNPYVEPYLEGAQNDSAQSVWRDPDSIFKNGITYTRQVRQEASLYIVVMPEMLNVRQFTLSTDASACDLKTSSPEVNQISAQNPLGLVGGNITMLHCRLYNSTYKTQFTYLNGQQNVTVNVTRLSSDPTVPIINEVRGAGSFDMGANSSCTTLNSVETDYGKLCEYDDSIPSQLAYQGVLQAFSNLVTGNITLDLATTNGPSDATRLRSTGLVNTKELHYLTDYELHIASSPTTPDLQSSLVNSSMSNVNGLTRLKAATTDRSLQNALEEMFQNFTVSLMSSSALQPNYSSPSAPPKTAVTLFTAQTVYSYSARKLWAAYGAAVLVTLACVLIGMLTIFANGASYSNSFSTVFRFARTSHLNVEIRSEDLNGESPLPKYLQEAQVMRARNEEAQQVESSAESEK